MKCFSIVKKNLLIIERYGNHKRGLVARDQQVSLYLSLTVDYTKEINSFMPILSIRIGLSLFCQLIFFF